MGGVVDDLAKGLIEFALEGFKDDPQSAEMCYLRAQEKFIVAQTEFIKARDRYLRHIAREMQDRFGDDTPRCG